MLMKNFPTITIKTVKLTDPKHFEIHVRMTNPNMTKCIIKLQKLKESQGKVINPTCSVSMPQNELQLDFHNDLLGTEGLNLSTEIQDIETKDEDKQFIQDKAKNYILFKLPGKMKEGLDTTKDVIRFGFNLIAKFERESTYQIRVPVYLAYQYVPRAKE